MLSTDDRYVYLSQIKQILKKNGIIFLKCISEDEKNIPDDKGSHKFYKDAVMYETLKPLPKALFFVMKKSVKI